MKSQKGSMADLQDWSERTRVPQSILPSRHPSVLRSV
jgi:hypothetical protein